MPAPTTPMWLIPQRTCCHEVLLGVMNEELVDLLPPQDRTAYGRLTSLHHLGGVTEHRADGKLDGTAKKRHVSAMPATQ